VTEKDTMDPEKLFRRLLQGHVQNVAFSDMMRLVECFSFRLKRIRGSHHIFECHRVHEILNFQDDGGQAKPYQIKQFLRKIERHKLQIRDKQ